MPIRTLLVGCGDHARAVIHTAVGLIPELDVIAVCDLDAAKAKEASRRFGSCPSFGDLDTMIASCEADAAIIVAPPSIQAGLVVRCLNAGLHVFVEKPLFVSLEEWTEIYDLSRARPALNVSVSFNKRYSPYIQQIKEIIATDSFGRPSYIYAKFAGGYRNGATDLLRVGAIHYFDLAQFFFGQIARISAISYEKQPGQAHIAVNIDFAGGMVGNFFLSSLGLWSAKGAEELEIRGDKSFVSLVNLHELTWQKPPLSVRKSQSSHQAGVEIPSPAEYLEPNYSNISLVEYQSIHRNGYLPRLNAFVSDVQTGCQTGPGIEAAKSALDIAIAVEKSIESRGEYMSP